MVYIRAHRVQIIVFAALEWQCKHKQSEDMAGALRRQMANTRYTDKGFVCLHFACVRILSRKK